MTIRNRALADRYSDFRYGCEKAPDGLFVAGKQIMAMLSDMMDGMEAPAKDAGFVVSTCDRAFEIEAAMFDMIYEENPLYQGEIDQLVGLGETLRNADCATMDRIILSLERDRDFVRSIQNNTHRLVQS